MYLQDCRFHCLVIAWVHERSTTSFPPTQKTLLYLKYKKCIQQKRKLRHVCGRVKKSKPKSHRPFSELSPTILSKTVIIDFLTNCWRKPYQKYARGIEFSEITEAWRPYRRHLGKKSQICFCPENNPTNTTKQLNKLRQKVSNNNVRVYSSIPICTSLT